MNTEKIVAEDKFVGRFLNNKKHGLGVMTWNLVKKDRQLDEIVYDGNWKDGQKHGYGYYTLNGISRNGLWENDIRKKWFGIAMDKKYHDLINF